LAEHHARRSISVLASAAFDFETSEKFADLEVLTGQERASEVVHFGIDMA
jgi:hypothetical protein